MLIKWKGRERTRLLLVLPSNSYYPQRKHWPAPEQQAHTFHVLGSAEPCPRCPPAPSNLSGASQSATRWAGGTFLFPTPPATVTNHLTWCFSGNPRSPVCQPCSRSAGQAVQLQQCSTDPSTLGQSTELPGNLRRKRQTKHQMYWCAVHLFKLFSSFKCFAPSGKYFSKSTCWNLKKTNEF